MKSNNPPPRPRSKTTVLVVDDHEVRRYAHGKVLAQAGFRVLQVANGRQALDQAAAADAVLLDVHLPDIDGFEVCRILRSRAASAALPIIHISAVFVQDLHAEQGRDAGADAYLIDPVPPEVLVQVLDSTIAARLAQQSQSLPRQSAGDADEEL